MNSDTYRALSPLARLSEEQAQDACLERRGLPALRVPGRAFWPLVELLDSRRRDF